MGNSLYYFTGPLWILWFYYDYIYIYVYYVALYIYNIEQGCSSGRAMLVYQEKTIPLGGHHLIPLGLIEIAVATHHRFLDILSIEIIDLGLNDFETKPYEV